MILRGVLGWRVLTFMTDLRREECLERLRPTFKGSKMIPLPRSPEGWTEFARRTFDARPGSPAPGSLQ